MRSTRVGYLQAGGGERESRSGVAIDGKCRGLDFKEHLERLSEWMLVLLLGGMIYLGEWSWLAVGLAAFLFFVARPLSVFIGLAGTKTSFRLRAITGWFGVRGIGSIYYLMYAIQHGLPENLAREAASLTLTAIMLSVYLHGISTKPLLARFWRG